MTRILIFWICLYATIVVAGAYNVENYIVVPDVLPGMSSIPEERVPEMHAGLLNLEPGRDYFFWRFSETDSTKSSILFWLNGGPGCSSMDGALLESGPLRVVEDGTVELNEGSWYTRSDMVFVDQPTGTGLSNNGGTKQYDNDLSLSTKHFMQFLKSYFQLFPQDLDKDIILAGESYAGQYIPYIADGIISYNKKRSADEPEYRLKSLLIGNGWIDPDTQSLSYIPYALEKGIISKENQHFTDLLHAHEKCQNKISTRGSESTAPFSYSECEDILRLITLYTRDDSSDVGDCLNIYDYTLRDTYPACGMNWPTELPAVSKFFSTEGVLEALNLDSAKMPQWQECNNDVLTHFSNPISKPSRHILPTLLEKGVNIILYSGDNDIVCNNKGILDMLDDMEWLGSKGFGEDVQNYKWVHRDLSNGEEVAAGFVQYDRNLTFINIYNASHMVPYDKSIISRGIMDLYLNDVELEEADDGSDVLVTITSNGDNDEGKSENPGNDSEDEEDSDIDDDADEEFDDDSEEVVDDDDEDVEKDRNSHDQKSKKPSGPKIILLTCATLLLIIAIFYYIARRNLSKNVRAIVIDPMFRGSSSGKTVSWADDLENSADTEFDLNDEQPSASSYKPTRKQDYTSVPNTDGEDSFEI